ncbi:hypothetical protein M0R72_20870 [Candidatus Pacearchaeota archaeon]|jgi:hypothetical protein|nr:hypothetical protein [Candidatus Pacearchaeota archaeon]
MTEENFDRYVAQHDKAEARFMREHNGCLHRLEQGQNEIRELLEKQHAEVTERLTCLETKEIDRGAQKKVVSSWKSNAAWFLGIVLTLITITSLVIALVK